MTRGDLHKFSENIFRKPFLESRDSPDLTLAVELTRVNPPKQKISGQTFIISIYAMNGLWWIFKHVLLQFVWR